MDVKLFKIDMEHGTTLYRSRVTSPLCDKDTEEGAIHKSRLLSAVANTPDLLRCGPLLFDKMRMFHSGEAWVIELEAVGVVG